MPTLATSMRTYIYFIRGIVKVVPFPFGKKKEIFIKSSEWPKTLYVIISLLNKRLYQKFRFSFEKRKLKGAQEYPWPLNAQL